MLTISIIIPTFNRAEVLSEAIVSVLQHTNNYSNIEVIIIDNNSSDNTYDIVLEFMKVSSIVFYFKEENQGLSHAKNRAIKESSGDIIIFLDDDIEIDDKWLNAILEPFEDDSVAVVGGKVLPYKVKIPDWLPEQYYFLVSIFDPSNNQAFVSHVMGGNCAIRKSVFEKIGLFDITLGRNGNILLSGEENDLYTRISRLGLKICYTPHAIIYHKINNKLNSEYIFNYAFFLGRSSGKYEKNYFLIKFLLKYMKNLLFISFYLVASLKCNQSMKFCISNTIKLKYAKGYLTFWKILNA